ncbi:MAG: DMT family transporter [Actinomyces sp.]|uniref:DMT family transporter n=1 Tax=Actinomyces sp. TaxID=29317 RepID=UPI0026DD5B70|nr:DMT family transporter [Actinomyces sp.]MDO4242372.1 DMT family transporter [Actinomyces sp.]
MPRLTATTTARAARVAQTARAALPVTALLVVTALWGSTFIILKDALDHIEPADFLAVRFAIAATVMVALTGRRLLELDRRRWVQGLGLGALYGIAQILQTVGLRTTDASVSGFITGMYVVLTPAILVAVTRTAPSARVVTASAMALAGLAVLSLTGTSLSTGAMITFGGSVVYALHIVALSRVAHEHEAMTLTATQMVGIALVCAAAGVPGGVEVPGTASVWGPVLYMALATGIGTMFLQTWAQARMSPTRAAVVMTCEPVFAALFAIALGDETLSGRLALGGALIVSAMLLSEMSSGPPDDAPLDPRPPGPPAGEHADRPPHPSRPGEGPPVGAATAASGSLENHEDL